jgi:hypothetical protein
VGNLFVEKTTGSKVPEYANGTFRRKNEMIGITKGVFGYANEVFYGAGVMQ